MKVTEAVFVKSALKPSDFPKDGRPEIAFIGRSNVGKSSLLNSLLGRKGLAKTSATPGKTQTLNFFSVNNRYYFVDLPGYGYAKVPMATKEEWGRALWHYLETRKELRLVVLLIDGRHDPSAQDHQMLEALDDAQRPTLIVATKVDKLKQAERARVEERFRDAFGLDNDAEIIPYSAVTDAGRKELSRTIAEVLEDAPRD